MALAASAALGEEQVARYHERGYCFPVRVFQPHEIQALHERHRAASGVLTGRNNQKPHLLFSWLAAIVRDARILDPVAAILGPDLLCWSSQFFTKPAGDPGYVSWHQDGTYWGLSSPEVVTAWIAFTPSTPESGCMRVIPGSHRELVRHEDTFAADNMLSRGQEIAVEVDLARAVDVVLQPGEMSLHHVLIFHGSEPNRSHLPRVGYAIRYIPTHVAKTGGLRESASLVRGVDRYGHFDPEPAPIADLHPDAVSFHGRVIDQQLRNLYAGARERGRLGPAQEPAT
jgi:ectoine hydroxylase-related dioxygenase (phytanoyl-CoA dioxygenase family)